MADGTDEVVAADWCADRRVALPGRPRERCLADVAYRLALVRAARLAGRLPADDAETADGAEPAVAWPVAAVIGERAALCAACPEASGGICLALRRRHPLRAATIAVGVAMARAQCPLDPPRWQRWEPPATVAAGESG